MQHDHSNRLSPLAYEYAIEVRTDAYQPRIQRGDLIVVDLDKPLKKGTYCVAWCDTQMCIGHYKRGGIQDAVTNQHVENQDFIVRPIKMIVPKESLECPNAALCVASDAPISSRHCGMSFEGVK